VSLVFLSAILRNGFNMLPRQFLCK
jgi:hypothetical protein